MQMAPGQSQLDSMGGCHYAPGEYQPASLMMVKQVPSAQGKDVIESNQGIRKRPTYRFEYTIVWERWYF